MCLLRERTTKRLRRRSNFPKQTPNASDVAQTLPNKLPTLPTPLALCDKQTPSASDAAQSFQTTLDVFRGVQTFLKKLFTLQTPLQIHRAVSEKNHCHHYHSKLRCRVPRRRETKVNNMAAKGRDLRASMLNSLNENIRKVSKDVTSLLFLIGT